MIIFILNVYRLMNAMRPKPHAKFHNNFRFFFFSFSFSTIYRRLSVRSQTKRFELEEEKKKPCPMMIFFMLFLIFSELGKDEPQSSVVLSPLSFSFILNFAPSLSLSPSLTPSFDARNLNISLLGTFGNQLNSSWTTKPHTEKSMCAWALFHYTTFALAGNNNERGMAINSSERAEMNSVLVEYFFLE